MIKVRTVIGYAWRLIVCALAFFAGIMRGSMAAGLTGLPAPELPAGTAPTVLMQRMLLGARLIAVVK